MTQPLVLARIVTTGEDAYGDEVTDIADVPEPFNGYLEQQASTEFTADRDTAVGQWVAYVPASLAVGHLDRIIADQSQTFEVDGEPEHVYNPRRKRVAYIVCKLKVVT